MMTGCGTVLRLKRKHAVFLVGGAGEGNAWVRIIRSKCW